MDTVTKIYTPWIERKVGEWFEIDFGGHDWHRGRKITLDSFALDAGYVIKVSPWTWTR